jgi:hypothetical protein
MAPGEEAVERRRPAIYCRREINLDGVRARWHRVGRALRGPWRQDDGQPATHPRPAIGLAYEQCRMANSYAQFVQARPADRLLDGARNRPDHQELRAVFGRDAGLLSPPL